MNDYFQHLTDRSTNQTPAIRPQLPSLFESPDFYASPVIAALEAETIHHPQKITAGIPASRPHSYEPPDIHTSTAMTDSAAETIHHPREKTARKTITPVPPDEPVEKETNHLRTVDRSKQSGADIRAEEKFPQTLIRGNASENHEKDTQDTTSLLSHEQATGTHSKETINSVSGKTVLKNARYIPAMPDRQTYALPEYGANQKPDTHYLTADKTEQATRPVSPVEPAAALRTSETVTRQTQFFPARVGKPPKIRPLIATQAGPRISSAVMPQQAPPEKTIRVTIGRIEVRAVMPQAQLSRPQTDTKEIQPKISLEDYLKKQRGGSR